MYKIIHVDKGWIVCTAQGELFIFDRRWLAVKIVHDAKKLLHEDDEKRCVAYSAVNGRAA